MRTKLSKIAQAAALGLAITFTFSCSGGDDVGNDPSSDSGAAISSSSSGGSGGGEGNNISGYRTQRIGDQVWMAENLNYDVAGSKCYNDEPSNCATYGRLYNWSTAMGLPSSCNSTSCASQINAKHRGICPSGWHIPSDAEWTTLTDYVGSNAGTKLKATSGWNSYSGVPAGTDVYSFFALPGGSGSSYGSFYSVGDRGLWWSASEDSSGYAYGRYMDYDSEGVYYNYYDKSGLFSVRCLQD
jgi:uncharacterized protein (TIGR02145 family)